jgi:hypothetical protein
MYTKTKQQFRAFTNFLYLYFVIKVAFKLNYMKFNEIIVFPSSASKLSTEKGP